MNARDGSELTKNRAGAALPRRPPVRPLIREKLRRIIFCAAIAKDDQKRILAHNRALQIRR